MMFCNVGDYVNYSHVKNGTPSIVKAQVFTVDKRNKTARLFGFNRDFPISLLTQYKGE